VDVAYSPGAWGTFAVGLTTASGALTGLVFVAVSIRVDDVLGDPFHRRRAESTFVILLATLTASLLMLLPGQSRVALGIEILLVGAVLIFRSVRTWPIVRAYTKREAYISFTVGTGAHVLLVIGALSVLGKTGGGLYIVAAALLLELVRALSDIWVLFSGITAIGKASAVTDRGRGA
jgi:modulator of FtsH protease